MINNGMVPAAAIIAVLLGTPVQAADMAVKSPPVMPPVFSWTGFYVGLNAGGYDGRLSESQSLSAPNCSGPDCPALLSFLSMGHNLEGLGLTGGVEGGYNLQFNNIV